MPDKGDIRIALILNEHPYRAKCHSFRPEFVVPLAVPGLDIRLLATRVTAALSGVTLGIQVVRGNTSPTFEQLTHSHMRLPVLVYERVKIAQHLRFIKRYRRKLVFAGKVEVVTILLVGLTGYWYLSGTKYASCVVDGLLSILAAAKLDDTTYKVTDWYQKKGQLLVHVTKAFTR